MPTSPTVLLVALVACTACADARGGPSAPDRPDTPSDTASAPAPASDTVSAAAANAASDTASARALGDPAATGTIVAVHVVSRVGGSGVADDQPKRARRDDAVTLHVALEVADGRARRWYSDAGAIRVAGARRDAQPIAEAPAFTIAWRRVEPTAAEMSNEASGRFRYEPIGYDTTPLAAGVAAVAADVRPTLTPNHGDAAAPGVGTMRYQVVVTQGDRTIASPGPEARRGRGSGGLTDAVHRVSLRRDDTYLGYLTEMYGQPYIWASAGGTDATHQSERLEGSDCADFIVYGARRMGKRVPYVWTGALPDHARTLGNGTLRDDGVYVDARGEPLPFPEVGDLVLFPRHVGALAEDRGVPGVLDTADLMMHTLFDSPKEEPIADSGYADKPVTLLRFR